MKIKFRNDVSVEDSLVFEKIYDENLQMDAQEKQELKEDGAEFIYMVDAETGDLIGETYFCPLDLFKDEEPDELQPDEGTSPYFNKNYAYCYSTTILPKYQGMGFGKLLKSYYLGYIKAKGFSGSIGHAKDVASVGLNTGFGGNVVRQFDNWYQTGETHFLYVCDF